jgi:peptidoglycan hydrolase CwlO-like protein
MVKVNEIELNEQKIILAGKKIELLEDERNIYLREKNDLLKKNADETELEKFDLKISEIDASLKEEQNKIKSAESNINSLKSWISDADALQEKLRTMMDSEYERDKTIAEFTLEEVKRLEKERQALDEEFENLNLLKNELSEKRAGLNSRIESLEEETELVRSKELSEILAGISELESEEAQLAQKEKEMIAESETPGPAIARDVLDSMENSIEMKRKEIDKLRSEIAEDEAQLAQQMSDIEAVRSKNVRNLSRTVLIIVLIAVVVTGGLYMLGRRRRKSAEK